MPVIRILHLEADPGFSLMVESMLQTLGPESAVTRAGTREQFETALATGLFHVILSDHRIPGYDGMEALDYSRLNSPNVPFIFVSGTPGEELAVSSLRNGASDYVLKSNVARLVPVILRAVRASEETRLQRESQERVRRDQADLRALIENTSDAIWSLDDGLRVVTFNSAASLLAMKLAGNPLQERAEFMGSLSDQGRAWWQRACERVLGGERLIEEYVLTWKGNRYRLEISMAPIMADGRPKGIAVFARDGEAKKFRAGL